MNPRVYLDTNIFIATFETAGARSDHAWWILDAAEDGRIDCVTSELTLAELLSKPPDDAPKLIADYLDMMTDRPGMQVVTVSRAILLEAAAARRATPGLKLPDAIHLATAVDTSCSFIVTRDLRLHMSGITVLRPGPHALDQIVGTAA